jgi:hypothetical protein
MSGVKPIQYNAFPLKQWFLTGGTRCYEGNHALFLQNKKTVQHASWAGQLLACFEQIGSRKVAIETVRSKKKVVTMEGFRHNTSKARPIQKKNQPSGIKSQGLTLLMPKSTIPKILSRFHPLPVLRSLPQFLGLQNVVFPRGLSEKILFTSWATISFSRRALLHGVL